jgi:putative flippase GtrA
MNFNLFGVRRFAIYALVGGVGTLVQYIVLIALVSARLASPPVASVFGAALGAVINYWLNRWVTFKSTASRAATLPKFAAIALFGVILNGTAMSWLTLTLHVQYLLAQCLSTLAILMLTYLLNSVWTFKGHSDDATLET